MKGSQPQKSGSHGDTGGSSGRMGMSSKACNGPARSVGHSIGAQARGASSVTQSQTGRTAGTSNKSGHSKR